jgi:hypothetical protein
MKHSLVEILLVTFLVPPFAVAGAAAAGGEGSVSARCADVTGGACVMARPFRDHPQTALRLAEVTNGEKRPELMIFMSEGTRQEQLPRFYGSEHWSSCEIPFDDRGQMNKNAVVAGDFSGRGREDLAVVGECMTGIGPTGGEPFYVGAIYLAEEGGQFVEAESASRRLTELLGVRCRVLEACDVRGLAQLAAR